MRHFHILQFSLNPPVQMSYFLRYTATPLEDERRGTSLHLVDDPDSVPGAEFINDQIGWGVVLDGLCAHSVQGESEEDAIKDAVETVLWARENSGASGNYPEDDRYAAWLFEGTYSDEDCPDGVMFHPKKIIANISKLADNA